MLYTIIDFAITFAFHTHTLENKINQFAHSNTKYARNSRASLKKKKSDINIFKDLQSAHCKISI